jgi:hypothetical protein
LRYSKLIQALIAGLIVAVPALLAANQDNHLSLQEILTVAGLFLPAVAVGLGPANVLTTAQLVDQAHADPNLDVVGKDYLGDRTKIVEQ